jgi:hypothetical protein
MIGKKIDEQRGWKFVLYSLNIAGGVFCLVAPGRYDVVGYVVSMTMISLMFKWRRQALTSQHLWETEQNIRQRFDGEHDVKTDAPWNWGVH